MRNKIIILLVLFLTLSLFIYGKKDKKKEIRLTKKNFNEYFEFVIVSDPSHRYYTDSQGKDARVFYGWQLKKEITEKYSHVSFLTTVVARFEGHDIPTCRIEFDAEDPEVFTVLEQTGILEDFTCSLNCTLLDNPKTGEKHWGFFKPALSAEYGKTVSYYADLPEPQQLTLVSVNGVLSLFN